MFSDRDIMDRWKALSLSWCPQLPCESVQRQPENPSYSILGIWVIMVVEIVGGENSAEGRE